jgi:hypothetical protein
MWPPIGLPSKYNDSILENRNNEQNVEHNLFHSIAPEESRIVIKKIKMIRLEGEII